MNIYRVLLIKSTGNSCTKAPRAFSLHTSSAEPKFRLGGEWEEENFPLVHSSSSPNLPQYNIQNGSIQAPWFARCAQNAHPSTRPTLGRQAIQEARLGNCLQVQPIRRCLSRQGHRLGKDVRLEECTCDFSHFLCISRSISLMSPARPISVYLSFAFMPPLLAFYPTVANCIRQHPTNWLWMHDCYPSPPYSLLVSVLPGNRCIYDIPPPPRLAPMFSSSPPPFHRVTDTSRKQRCRSEAAQLCYS